MAKNLGRPSEGGGMMQQIQRLQQQLAEAQSRLAEESVTGIAGGGAVKVVMTGDQKCKSVEISVDLVKEAELEKLQNLIQSAVNAGLDKSRALASKRLGPLARGLPF